MIGVYSLKDKRIVNIKTPKKNNIRVYEYEIKMKNKIISMTWFWQKKHNKLKMANNLKGMK